MAAYTRITNLDAQYGNEEAKSVAALFNAWKEQHARLKTSRAIDEFTERLYRSWAIETGIIERLYSLDRGVTRTLIERGLNAAEIPHGASDRPAEEVIRVVQSHREAIDFLLDEVGQNRELSTSFIKGLHQLLTKHQDTVDAVDQFGNKLQKRLVKGDWKAEANNPERPDGQTHEYCPPLLVKDEMEQLIAWHREHMHSGIPALVESAWLHHRFTQIHPFQDGNGRVARALSALVLVRAQMFPVVVDRDDRSHYISALEQADAGDLDPLVVLWSRLERKAIQQALAVAAQIDTGSAPSTQTEQNWKAVVGAIGERLRQRQHELQRKQKNVFRIAEAVSNKIGVNLNQLADTLKAQFSGVTPAVSVARDDSAENYSTHWFRWQVTELARHFDYYADYKTYHRWHRLKLIDDETAEMVFSIHCSGYNFSGVMTVSGYFGRREVDVDGRSQVAQPIPIVEETFVFSFTEAEEAVMRRLDDWLNQAILVGLEQWRVTL